MSALPSNVTSFLGDTAAELLEQELGGAVQQSLFLAAPSTLANYLATWLKAYPDAPTAEGLGELCAGAVELFKSLLSESAKTLLAQSSGADYCVDVQNAILAFAGRVLLRGCDLRFERGRRYGLIGQNGVGKTTLLGRLAAKDITGFPQDLKTWYIRHEVVCEDGVSVREFAKTMAPAEANDEATVVKALDDVGFPETLQIANVTQLSGGWKMKLSIAISILHKPELLLLDEPTNHLDINAVRWLTQYLLALTRVTICVVSHDYDFIEEVCTDITHYDNGGKAGAPCRLMYYPMGFSAFQQLKPEIAAGLPTAEKAMQAVVGGEGDADADDGASAAGSSEASADVSDASGISATLSKVEEMMASGQILPIRFPDPGKPEGIRTYRKPILTMKNISFRYKGTEKWILTDASVSVTLGSRAVLLGANGAGKSTFLKLIVGDLELEAAEGHKGESWKHHNLRVSYIAQHSLHHLEEYLNETPMHYIQERFRLGMDRELSKLKTLAITEEEQEIMRDIGSVAEVTGRQQRGKQMWYEVVKTGRKKNDTQWFPLDEIKNPKAFKPYVLKLVKNYDERQMALDSGMAIRPITSTEIIAHLEDFGIEQLLAHGKIKQMSGGQRQRLVLCAAFWSKPHMICLDEPTNYLDNDTLAALTQALKTFKGGVITVSHNEAFVGEIANVRERRGSSPWPPRALGGAFARRSAAC
jgi:elongation factor 3